MTNVNDIVQERIIAARRRAEQQKKRRAEFAERRRHGLAARRAAKLAHLALKDNQPTNQPPSAA